MMNSEVPTRNVITVDDDDMVNDGEFLDGLVRLYGAKHMQEGLMIEDDDDDFEDI